MKKAYGRKLELTNKKPEMSKSFNTFHSHRFYVKPTHIKEGTEDPKEWAEEAFYLTLKAVRFEPPKDKNDFKRLVLEHYIHDDNIDKLVAAKYPTKLTIVLLDGTGKSRAKINLSGVQFIRNRPEKLQLDYANPEIMTLEAELTYEYSEMVAP